MKKMLRFGLLFLSFVLMTARLSAQTQEEEKAYYNFGGHVYSEDFPIVSGYAYLYEYSNGSHTPVDTAVIDTLGHYNFYQKPEGQYLVFAGLDTLDPYFGQFAFTYYPKSSIWQEAGVINLQETSWEYHIHLVNMDPEQMVFGPGTIAGNIQDLEGKPIAEGVDVIIFDENFNPLLHWPTNNQGRFNFEDLAYGKYVLYPQITGYSTEPIYITISEDQAEYKDIEITIKDGSIASYIDESLIDMHSFLCYPNPVSNQLNIRYESKESAAVDIQVYNIQGQMVYELHQTATMGVQLHQIEVADWVSGFYFLHISIGNATAVKQQFVVSH